MSALYSRWRALVDAAPDRLALQAGDEAASRAMFDARIDDARGRLEAAGVGRGDIVAWLGQNSAEMLAMLFACARSGAVFLPLNGRLAHDELAAVLRHAGAKRLLGSADAQAAVTALQSACADEQGPAGIEPDDLLLVYTSGTSGKPKGALHTQAAMLANAQAAIDVQGIDERTRTLAVLPLFHVGGLCIQTLPTLLAGGVVNLHPRFDTGAWLRDVQAWRPTTSLLVPATMRMLLDHPRWPQADLSSLTFVNSGSSVVPLSAIEAFHARGVPVAQVYGATETGPVSIALRPGEAFAQAGRVGRAAPGVDVRLVGDDGRDVPDGQVGEIRLRGPNLMRGYHREPAHAGFVDGWFATGDLARRDEHGCYEVVGRSKDMIISGGENVYPAEIENLLAGERDIAECAVVGLPDARWGEVPVLAVVAREGATVDAEALMARIGPRLARYKHPRRVVVIDGLPKTALGKVVKTALVERLMRDA